MIIEGSVVYDLDAGKQATMLAEQDFHWKIDTDDSFLLIPRNVAKFYVYSN